MIKMRPNKFNFLTDTPDPVCAYKWGWSTIFLQQGKTSSCHRTFSDTITPETFSTFHNTPTKLKTRQSMLNGDWPGHGCEYCKDIEKSGGKSDRIDLNNHSDIDQYIPVELQNDNTAINIQPTMLEVYFSNLCNMNCVYCDYRFSSTWENEVRKHNLVNIDYLDNLLLSKEDYEKMLSEYWRWFKDNAKKLKKYNVLGGEPFFQPELYKNIDFFEENPCPELIMTVFSNLKVDEKRFRKTLDQIQSLVDRKHLRYFRITASIDCWGPQQEYVRTGLNLKQWEKNFRILVTEYPDIKVELHGTLSCLTIKTIPELLRLRNELNEGKPQSQKINVTHNLVTNPKYMAPGIFPEGYFDADFDRIINMLPDEYDKEIMRGYQNTINRKPYEHDKILKLKEELSIIDKRRNMDYKPLFPWLEEFK